MMRVTKKTASWAFACLLIVLIIIALEPEPVMSSFTDSSWVTTTNAIQGYSLQRPASSEATFYLPEQILQIELQPGLAILSIRIVANPGHLSTSDWVDTNLLDPQLRGTTPLAPPLPSDGREDFLISGIPATKFLVYGPVETIQRTVVTREDQVFLIDHPSAEGELRDLYDQIISSLEFGEFPVSAGLSIEQPDQADDIPNLPVPYYSQRDPRWTCDQIGSCWCYLGNCWGFTGIGDAGCYITSEAMIFDYYTDGYMDPLELDTCLTNNGGYGLWEGCGWGLCATTYDPISACKPASVTYEGLSSSRPLLDEDLQNGFPVIAWVDGGIHYLVIIGKQNGMYQVNDPLYPRTSIYSGEIIYYVRLHGSPPAEPALDTSLQSGFPAQAYTSPETPPATVFHQVLVANLDNDPYLEIASTALNDGPLYVWDADGSLTTHWPQGMFSGQAYPSAGRLVESPQTLSVIAGYEDGALTAYEPDGSPLPGWPLTISPGVAPPSLADVDGDGIEEIFIPSGSGQLTAYHADGSLLAGWPAQAPPGQIFTTPAITDLDGDSDLEIIALSGPADGSLQLHGFSYNGQELPSFPISIPAAKPSVPVIGDVDNDGQKEIIVAAAGDSVRIYSADGALERSLLPEGPFTRSTAPALADLNGDGVPEIIVQADRSLDAWEGDGTIPAGWPDSWGTNYLSGDSSPVVGDVNGDGLPDVVITVQSAETSSLGELRIYDQDGMIQPGLTKSIPIGSGAIPAIADIDLDEHNEIILAGTSEAQEPGFTDKLWVIDLGGEQHGDIEWGQFGGGPEHRGMYPVPRPPSPTGVPPVDAGTAFLPLVRGKSPPLPASIHGSITIGGQEAAGIPVSLSYFNGTNWTDWISLATAADGSYTFVSPPGLALDEQYRVHFENLEDTAGLVTTWESRPITNYQNGGSLGISQVDLADLQLVSPGALATVSLPQAFSWSPPSGSTSLLFRFVLYDPADNDPLYQGPLLMGEESYSLSSLPPGFSYDQPYAWTVWSYGADASRSIPSEARQIIFSSNQN